VSWIGIELKLQLNECELNDSTLSPQFQCPGVHKLCLHVAIFVSRCTFKQAWNAHWCVYTRSLIVFIVLNTKQFETWLKVGALNRIQHKERKTWGRTQLLLHALQISVIPRPSQAFPLSIFDRFEFLTYWKQSKTGRWEGLGMTLLQIRPVLISYVLIWPSSTIDSLHQIDIILQLHRCKAHSAAT